MSVTVTKRDSYKFFVFLALVIVLFGTLLRITNLMQLPMFTDEVLHITRAHRYWLRGDVFDGLEQNKWLYIFFLAQFKAMGPEGPWLARYLNILFAALSIAGCISLGRQLEGYGTGLLAGLLYAAMPLAVFHERQSLVDPMMTAFTTLSLVESVHLARRPRWWLGIILALTFCAAILTKPAALPFIIMPPVAVVLFKVRFVKAPSLSGATRLPFPPPLRGRVSAGRVGSMLSASLIWLSATAFTGALTLAIYRIAAAQGTTPHDTHTFRYANTGFGRFGWRAFFERIPSDLGVLLDIGLKYISVVGLLVIFAAIVLAAIRRDYWREVLFLSIPGLLFAAIPVLASRPTASDDIATRYLLPNAAALAALIALGVKMIVGSMGDHKGRPYMRFSMIIVIVLILAPMLWFDYLLLTDPPRAHYAAYDQRIYFEDDTSGYRYVDVSLALLNLWKEQRPHPLNVVGRESTLLYARAQLGPRVSNLVNNRSGSQEQRQQIETWLAAGQQVYIVEELGDSTRGPSGTQVEAIHLFEPGEPGIYIVTGLGQ